MRGRAVVALAGCLVTLLILASCIGDDGDENREGLDETAPTGDPPTVALPARDAPFNLAGLDLPDDVSGVVALMNRLPETIGDLVQADPIHGEGDVRIGYGADESSAIATPGITFRAINLASPEGTYPPNWRAGQVVEEATLPGDDSIEFGVDGNIAWARNAGPRSGTGTAPAAEQQELLFGETSGTWVFSVRAAGEELLASAMAQFEMAASGRP